MYNSLGGRERFKVVRFCDKRHELTPDEREMKEMFWDDSDAQRLLRSLARLRKTHKLVCKEDIDHDLLETEDHRMLKKVQGSLLQKFCDKSLISKDKSSNDKGNYSVPSVNRLAPFINPELGDSPPDDEDEDDDDVDDVDEDEDDYDSESSGLENGELCEENSSLGSKSQESLPGSMAMDCNDESKHLSKKVVSPVVCRDRTKVKSEPSTDVNNVTCRSDTVGIATRAKVDVQQIVRSYGKMTTRSRNSPIVSRLNLNNDENKLDGSKESPIPIESSDDSSVSSITMSFESNNEITTPSFRKSCRSSREIITPMQKCRDHMAMNSERLTNVEDVQWNEIKTPSSRKAVRSSRKIITRKKKCKDHAIDEEHLTNVEDVPMGGVGENRAGKCIEQPEKKRRVYYTDINDTTSKIAKRFQVDVEQVIRDNKRRKKYGNISKSSGFELNSPIVLPM